MAGIRSLVAGNWKMNGSKASLVEIEAVKAAVGDAPEVDVAICPPATLISRAATITANSPIAVGGQDCHAKASGAHTGDIAAEMLADAGATMVIVGHSERRADHDEDDATVRAKAEAGWRAGLTVDPLRRRDRGAAPRRRSPRGRRAPARRFGAGWGDRRQPRHRL